SASGRLECGRTQLEVSRNLIAQRSSPGFGNDSKMMACRGMLQHRSPNLLTPNEDRIWQLLKTDGVQHHT
ncbi:hypothetical protein TNCV_3197621, partial [Trichonephila clavipes]